MNTSLLMRIIVSTLGIEANLRRSELDDTIIVPAPKPTGGCASQQVWIAYVADGSFTSFRGSVSDFCLSPDSGHIAALRRKTFRATNESWTERCFRQSAIRPKT
jgi:hypothetical protein